MMARIVAANIVIGAGVKGE